MIVLGDFSFNFFELASDGRYDEDKEVFDLLMMTYRATLNFIKVGAKDDIRKHPGPIHLL